jgi:hypothetical protein
MLLRFAVHELAQFTCEDSAVVRFLSRSAYACWLNRDIPGVARYKWLRK